MKYLKLKDFLNLGIELREYNQGEIEAAKKRAEEISKFYPAEVLIRTSEYDGKKHFESASVVLYHPVLHLDVTKWKDKYSIHCPTIRELKNVSTWDLEKARKELTAPNQIGIFTTKKIEAWVNYYEEYYKNALAIDNQSNNEKEEFLKSLEGLPVRFYDNNKKGEIIQNGIKFSFHIQESYISKQIEVHYSVNASLDTFLKLSDNKLNS